MTVLKIVVFQLGIKLCEKNPKQMEKKPTKMRKKVHDLKIQVKATGH